MLEGMRRIIAQTQKELTQIWRDRFALTMIFVLPSLLLALLGMSISLTVKDLPIVVQDLDQSLLSQQYVDAFRASLTFRVASRDIAAQPDRALDKGEAIAALIIPEHFERDYLRGKPAGVQLLIDATDANTANLIRGAASNIAEAFATTTQMAKRNVAVHVNTRLLYNPGRDSSKYIAPAAVALALALFPCLLGALAMSREAEQKTIIQVYASSISAHEFLGGKILAYCIIGGLEWVTMLALAFVLFDLMFIGDPTPLLVGTAVYLFCNVGFGTMIGVVVPNRAAALQYVHLLGNLLSFYMSGYIYPVSQIPPGLRWISSLVPARYYIELLRDSLMRGGGWQAVWHAVFILLLLGSLFFFITWRSMRRMQVAV
jgi:ABC-2 type transport system permease protein